MLAARGVAATVSLAGRVSDPKLPPLPVRIGGFGGAAGLAAWMRAEGVTHLIDATHPFAAEISRNAAAAAAMTGLPFVALTRPPWRAGPGDDWTGVASVEAAADALSGPPRRVMLAIGRTKLAAFAGQPQHHYLLRFVDPPAGPLPFPQAEVVVDRGPFTPEGDEALMRAHRIEMVVAKNSGGTGASAKLAAARALGLPVLMIARPEAPARDEVARPEAVLDWLAAHGADLGV